MHLPVLIDGHHPDDRPRMPVTGLPAVCAQTCGSLVRNGAEPVHTQWKCWGFRYLAPTMTAAFTWESASRTLCMQRKPELSTGHAAIDN